MVRNYIKKTKRGEIPAEIFEKAYKELNTGSLSLRDVSKKYKIDKMTLLRYKKKKETGNSVQMGYAKPRKVFSNELELQLKEYITYCSEIYHGLSSKDMRSLAYQLAAVNNAKVPKVWNDTNLATYEWLNAFLKRHPTLIVKKPIRKSLSRSSCFIKRKLDLFFKTLNRLFDKYHFSSKDIWNADERGIQAIQLPSIIVSQNMMHQVGVVTSAENESTVAIAISVCANGDSVSPMFILPRNSCTNHLFTCEPPGCIGTAHSTGYMTRPTFLLFIKHFHSHVKSTKERPCLLILNYHESYLHIPVLDYCKENGIILLSFPPHTSQYLQPLDKTIFGSLMECYFAEVDNWKANNPGKTLNVCDIPRIVNCLLPKVLTSENIISGFKATGIMPFNPSIFTGADFLSSAGTKRPLNKSIKAERVSSGSSSDTSDTSESISRSSTPVSSEDE